MQELRLRQQMTLAPRLQQSVKLLQMSALEFTTAVELALASNPFLEEADEQAAGPAEAVESTAPVAAPSDSGQAASDTASEQPAEPPATPEYAGDYPTAPRGDGEDHDLGQWASAPVSMREKLSLELGNYRLEPRDRLLAEFIIDSLDEDGYLRTPPADLCGSLSPDFTPPPEEQEWLTALRLVQQLDAPGLGARDLQECLALQLEAALGINPPLRALALRIVREQIDRLAKNDAASLRRAFNCTDDDVRDACALIRSLDPKPGRRYDAQAPAYVVPDVFVDKWRSRWRVVPNRGAMPQARLHQVYADLFRRARLDDRSPMAQELQEAR